MTDDVLSKPLHHAIQALQQEVCPALSPWYRAARDRFEKWIADRGLFDRKTTQLALAANFPLAAALVFPQAGENMLFSIAKYYALFTIVDDILEKDPWRNDLCDDVMSFLRHGYATGNVFSLLHKEVREEIKLSARQTAHIALCYERFLESALTLHRKKQHRDAMTVEEYSRYRMWDVEVAQDFALHDQITGTTLPEEAWSHPLTEELLTVYCRCIWLENDYLSLPKDYRNKNDINFILVLSRQEQIPVTAALSRCYELIVESRQELVYSCEQFCRQYPHARAFSESVRQGVYGYCAFTLISGRYELGRGDVSDCEAINNRDA